MHLLGLTCLGWPYFFIQILGKQQDPTERPPEQFLVYKQVSGENKFFNKNYNNHYGDDGCVCTKCFVKRKKLLANLKLNSENIIKTPIKHPYDNKYDNALLLKVYGEKKDFTEPSTIITINYVNFF